ncbi:ABC transporter substrate-binding protein [Kineococcus indalonis]|uniref:ABC transporter substrate-binding protein n=1 Tax=Kineococcus indalonis TaxID=2696566 RepID=UPI00196AB94A|nr:extracellular solute-binding protein [Kineococcus indalonis]
MQTTRRGALGAALGVGAMALGGCAVGAAADSVNQQPLKPRADGPITLTYWSWLKDLQSVCDLWNADHPDVQVQAVWSGAGTNGGYTRMFAALAAGGGSDIAQVEFQLLPSFLLQNGLVDLSRYGFRDHLGDYREADISRVSVGDGIFGVPQDTGPVGWFHRRDVLDALGAVPPATWPEWADLARAVKEADPANRLEGFPINDPNIFTSLCMQAGAAWFTPEGEDWVVDIAGAPTRTVGEFMDAAFDEDLYNTALAPFSSGWTAAAAGGSIAAVTTGSWGDALVQSVGGTEGLWGVAPMPLWPGTGFPSATLGGSTGAVLATSQHPAEAADFLHWMTTDPAAIDAQIVNCGIGWSPSPDYVGASREQPSEFFGGQNYNQEVFVPAADAQNPDWTWSPVFIELNDALSTVFRERLTGGRPVVDGLADVQEQTIAIMRDKGLRVRAGSEA